MARIAQSSIDQVVATADIVDVVSQYTDLRKAGANYSGRCPFHEERTPSFSVNPTEKLYYCFGCGAGGNLIGFVMAKENMDFPEAVEYLADRYGIALEYEESSARGDAERRRRERLRALLEDATRYYERVLWTSPAAAPAREYLAGRGLSEEVCRAFRVGYSLPGWERLRDGALAKGFNEQDLLDAGLVIPGKHGRPYDRFRGRIMFPLGDERGRTLGFGARTMGDEKPKYLNSPETPLYHKSEALFGIDKAKAAARQEDRVYVVEGYTDVLALAQAGVINVVASMGTALTEQQLDRLRRLTRTVYLCYDADAAGVGAMQRALELGRRMGLALHVVRIPDGLDPADYVLSGAGGDGFRTLADHAETLLQFHVRLALTDPETARPEGRVRVFGRLQAMLAQASELEYDDSVRQIAEGLSLSEANVRTLLRQTEAGIRTKRRIASADTLEQLASRGFTDGPAVRQAGGERELEVRFLAGCLARPEAGREAIESVDESFFASAETRAALGRVKERLAAGGDGVASPATGQGGADGGAEVLAEVIVRAGRERFTATVVEELFLRLQEAQVGRLIARLKLQMKGDDTGGEGEELARLEGVRRRLREALRALPVEDDSEQR
ncbi:MAG: DNA primase [Actinobacteria bacterium]|nr:DNA primase [Actinomycetota bacterium]